MIVIKKRNYTNNHYHYLGAAESPSPITFSLSVSTVSPNAGSMVGGTEVVITGSGFESGNKSDYKVALSMYNGDIPCDVTAVDAVSKEVTCITRGSGKVIKVDNNGISKGWSNLSFHAQSFFYCTVKLNSFS